MKFGTAAGFEEKVFELRVVDAATGHYVLDEEGVPELGAYYIGDLIDDLLSFLDGLVGRSLAEFE